MFFIFGRNRRRNCAFFFSGGMKLLVLSRKEQQEIVIDGGIRVRIVNVRGDRVKIGIEAPEQIKVMRAEILESDTSSHTEIVSSLKK